MNLEPFIKNKNRTGLLTLFVAGVLYIGYEMVSGGKIFSRLNEDQSFYILITGIGILFVFFIVLSLVIIFKKEDDSEESAVRNESKKPARTLPFVFALAAVGLIIWIGLKFYLFDVSTTIYIENFSSNDYPETWLEGRQYAGESFIQNGKYTIQAEKEFISRRIDIFRTFQFDLRSNDFKAELEINKLDGKRDNYGGLEWGANSQESIKYGFYLNGDREYSIKLYKHSNEIAKYVDWTYEEGLVKTSSNILAVIKRLSTISFFLNNKEIFVIEDLPILGNEVGFGANPSTTIEIERLIINNFHQSSTSR